MKSKLLPLRVILSTFLLATGIVVFQCTNEEELYTVSGTVSYAGGIPADGAVVTVSQDEAGNTVVNNIVCNSEGHYSLSSLIPGTYYLSSHFNTANVNNLKATGFDFKTSEPVAVEITVNDLVQDIQLVNEPGGDEIISTMNDSWRFDKPHSNINWSTPFMGQNALLTGKFNSFDVNIDFDESAPEQSSINAWVQLSSANTGEPGRDDLGKCLNGYLGVVTDTLADGSYYVSDPNTDTAYFHSSGVEVWGDGYKAPGQLSFRGNTHPAVLLFHYIGQADFSSEGDGSNIRGAFSGEFKFNAISDFGVTSSSIADLITVTINANYRKN